MRLVAGPGRGVETGQPVLAKSLANGFKKLGNDHVKIQPWRIQRHLLPGQLAGLDAMKEHATSSCKICSALYLRA